jgi:hypothetical protein
LKESLEGKPYQPRADALKKQKQFISQRNIQTLPRENEIKEKFKPNYLKTETSNRQSW